jgi:hypothetical protein
VANSNEGTLPPLLKVQCDYPKVGRIVKSTIRSSSRGGVPVKGTPRSDEVRKDGIIAAR